MKKKPKYFFFSLPSSPRRTITFCFRKTSLLSLRALHVRQRLVGERGRTGELNGETRVWKRVSRERERERKGQPSLSQPLRPVARSARSHFFPRTRLNLASFSPLGLPFLSLSDAREAWSGSRTCFSCGERWQQRRRARERLRERKKRERSFDSALSLFFSPRPFAVALREERERDPRFFPLS